MSFLTSVLIQLVLASTVLGAGATQRSAFKSTDPRTSDSLRDLDSSVLLDEDFDDESSNSLELRQAKTGDDTESFEQAWDNCLNCKKMSTGSAAKKLAASEFKKSLESCKSGCSTSAACIESAGYVHKTCTGSCIEAFDTCFDNLPAKFDLAACKEDIPPLFDKPTCIKACAKGKAGKDCRNACTDSSKQSVAERKAALKECSDKNKQSTTDIKGAKAACIIQKELCIDTCKDKLAVLKTCNSCPKTCKEAAQVTDASPVFATDASKRVRRHRKLRGAKIPDDGSMFLQGDVIFDDEGFEDEFDEDFPEEDWESVSHEVEGHVEL